ncbi:MAG: hypothetical protein FJ395_14500 [Verrucomicrobia bacterium]|nr:hypothetical protein [Verrucomicrobiota bacterium]
MKRILWLGLAIVLATATAQAATHKKQDTASPKRGLEAAKAITTVTGIAISPLLGAGGIGAWEYMNTPADKRDSLNWYAQPAFWIPALLLVAAVAFKDAAGTLTFDYRPWLFGRKRSVALPKGTYAVGSGMFYSEVLLVEGEDERMMLLLPPRYRTHEEEVVKAYGFLEVRATGLRRAWRWIKSLFGFGVKASPAVA